MNESKPIPKKYLIIVALCLIAGLIASLFLYQTDKKKDPSYTVKTVNKDTGEIIYKTPNRTPEQGGKPNENISVFGSFLLLDNGATPAQFAKTQELLNDYARKNLHGTYNSLTLIPKGFKNEAGALKGQMRLGETPKTVTATIRLSELTYVHVIINDPSGQNGGNYDSGNTLVDSDFYE